MDKRYAYILLSDERWWNRLCERISRGGETHVFVRRNLVGPLKAQTLFFYVKHPIMQIRGVADFVERLAGDHKELWNTHGGETCIETFKEYVGFLQRREKATFIRFKNFRELENPVPIKVIRKILGVLRMPRGGKYINREKANQLTV